MTLNMLKAKLHRVIATHAELDYEGSCAIDGHLLDVSGIREYEQIQIYNITNGERFETYAIRAEDKSGIISVNGAAAHKANAGDMLIIAAYCAVDDAEAAQHKPVMVYFEGGDNKISHTKNFVPTQLAEQSA